MATIPNKKHDIIHFIFKNIEILRNLRTESSLITDQSVKTLAIQLGISEDLEFSKSKKKIDFLMNKILSFIQFAKLIFLFLKYFNRYRNQYFLLKKKEVIDNINCSVVAIASNRIFSENISSSARGYLSQLCRDFLTGNLSDELKLFFSETNVIILHDPCHHSKFWTHREYFWKENIFILDTNFLFFLSLTFLIKDKFKFKALYNKIKKFNFGIKRIITSYFIDGLTLLFSSYSRIDSFFITSNSFLTEVIRFYLINNEKCSSTCEIMHGVPTIFYEKYINNILECGKNWGAYEKHCSIAQIPNLPMFGVLEKDVKTKPEYAINCYLNQYVYNAISASGCFEKYLENEINSFIKNKNLVKNVFIISLIGSFYPDNDLSRPNFFNSLYFKVELKIMQYLGDLLNRKNIDYMIIYTPHPSHNIQNCLEQSIFKENNIVIYPNTIFTWFIADVSLSILSSASFEGSYFGVSGFMLSDLKDGVYPKKLLNTLDFYNDTEILDKTIYQKLDEFIEENIKNLNQDLMIKSKKRIKTFNYQVLEKCNVC